MRLLLLHGAHADRRDKHGVTPEMLARDCGHEEVAEVLREWVKNKDRDLRDRERDGGGQSRELSSPTSPVSVTTSLALMGDGSGARPVHGGWGIGNGRDDEDENDRDRKMSGGRLKVKASIDQALNTFKSAATLQSYRDCPSSAVFAATPTTEPEDISFPRTISGPGSRRPSFPDYTPSSSSYTYARRPRSAGQGAQTFEEAEAMRERAPSNSQNQTGRKLASKYSLRNLFKKANDSTATSSADPSYTTTPNLSASPSPGPNPNLPLPNVTSGSGLLNIGPLPGESSPLSPLAPKGHRARAPSDGDTSMMNHRTRSGSGSGLPNEDDSIITSGNGSGGSARPSILRMHNRTSSGNGNGSGSVLLNSRAIRFDETGGNSSQTSLVSKARNGVARAVSGLERSLSPGRKVKRSQSAESFAEEGPSEKDAVMEGEGEEEEYGKVIRVGKTRLPGIKPDSTSNSHRGRGASFASSTCSLSPILSPDSATYTHGNSFPFSIDHPPTLDANLLKVPPSPYTKDKEGLLEVEETDETRHRGDSVSSASTDNTDANPQLSWSSSTTGTGSSVATSGGTGHTLLAPSSPASPGVGGRRAHTPGEIDIRSISSHAQAEALVQAAQQSILDMDISGSGVGKEGIVNGLPSPLFDGDELIGRSPLSARLAAYGETLALERRLKRAEEDRIAKGKDEQTSPTLMLFTRDKESQRSPRTKDRLMLPGANSSSKQTNPSRQRIRQPRRPNTSDSGRSLLYSTTVLRY